MGEGGEVLRILTRLWSEDSSTSVSIERAKSTKRRKAQARPPKQKATRKDQNTKQNQGHQHNTKQQTKKGGEGASVERPDTSLARQFKHFDTKQEKQTKHRTHKLIHGSQKGAIRGEGKGDKKQEALTVFSQKIQAQE